jgi:hypothetical protein
MKMTPFEPAKSSKIELREKIEKQTATKLVKIRGNQAA